MNEQTRPFWQIRLSTVIVLVFVFGAWLTFNTIVQPIDSRIPTFGIGFPGLFYYCSEDPSEPRISFPHGQPSIGDMLDLHGPRQLNLFWLSADVLCGAIVLFTVGGICEFVNKRRP